MKVMKFQITVTSLLKICEFVLPPFLQTTRICHSKTHLQKLIGWDISEVIAYRISKYMSRRELKSEKSDLLKARVKVVDNRAITDSSLMARMCSEREESVVQILYRNDFPINQHLVYDNYQRGLRLVETKALSSFPLKPSCLKVDKSSKWIVPSFTQQLIMSERLTYKRHKQLKFRSKYC